MERIFFSSLELFRLKLVIIKILFNILIYSIFSYFTNSFRYLAYLSTSLLLDEATGPFKLFPPDGALADLETLATPQVDAAEWEVDKCWQDTLLGLPDDFQMLECCVHANETECKEDHNLDKVSYHDFSWRPKILISTKLIVKVLIRFLVIKQKLTCRF